MGRRKKYPENLLDEIGLNEVCGTGIYYGALTADQMEGLERLMQQQATERERMVLKMRYANGMSMREIAALCGLSCQRIDQIINRAVKKCRDRELLLYVAEGYEARRTALESQLEAEEQRYRLGRGITGDGHIFYQKVSYLDLPFRVFRALIKEGICEVRELVILSQYEEAFKKVRGVGELTEGQIGQGLKKEGLIPEDYEKIPGKMPAPTADRELGAFRNLNRFTANSREGQ